MSDASERKGRGLTVTIKYGKGYEETWAVFAGLAGEVRDDIVAFFGIDRESVTGLTLSDVVVNATSIAHGVGNVARVLGGTVIASPVPREQREGGDPWVEAAARSATPPAATKNPLVERIEKASDLDALKRIWAENQAAFQDSAVMDAWKARGRALRTVPIV